MRLLPKRRSLSYGEYMAIQRSWMQGWCNHLLWACMNRRRPSSASENELGVFYAQRSHLAVIFNKLHGDPAS